MVLNNDMYADLYTTLDKLDLPELSTLIRIFDDNHKYKNDTEQSNLEKAMREYISFIYHTTLKSKLDAFKIKELFFKLDIMTLREILLVLRFNSDYSTKDSLYFELAKIVYSEVSELTMRKSLESMTYIEMRYYVERMTDPKSVYGSSSMDEYLFEEFLDKAGRITADTDTLTKHLYKRFHNADVKRLVEKYGGK